MNALEGKMFPSNEPAMKFVFVYIVKTGPHLAPLTWPRDRVAQCRSARCRMSRRRNYVITYEPLIKRLL